MESKEETKARTADSMAAAVAMLCDAADAAQRLTEEDLKRAKQGGCPAFRGSRVYVDELLEWWEENGDTLPTGNSELDAINLEIAREKLRKVRFANDVEAGRYILREDEAQKIFELGTSLNHTLRKRLEEEFPQRQANRTADEILALNRELADELRHDFAAATKKWKR